MESPASRQKHRWTQKNPQKLQLPNKSLWYSSKSGHRCLEFWPVPESLLEIRSVYSRAAWLSVCFPANLPPNRIATADGRCFQLLYRPRLWQAIPQQERFYWVFILYKYGQLKSGWKLRTNDHAPGRCNCVLSGSLSGIRRRVTFLLTAPRQKQANESLQWRGSPTPRVKYIFYLEIR